MLGSLRPTLCARLSAEFGPAARLGGGESKVVATFAALHAAVGEAVVLQEGDEIIVAIEPHTHHHFECYADRLSPDERVDEIVEQVIAFLHELFADRVVFGDRSGSGGSDLVSSEKRKSVTRALFGSRQLVWSGPVVQPEGQASHAEARVPMRASLRLIARCRADEYPAVVAGIIRSAAPVARLSPQAAPEPYWKREGHATFSFRVQPAALPTLAAIRALEPHGWDLTAPDPEADCVWNQGEGRQFLHPAVIWAEMAWFPEAPAAPSPIEPLE